MSLLRLHDVSKSFDHARVLRSIFFRLGEGDRVGLVGRNGTGKTTLLQLILGTEEPSGGEVQVEEGVRLGYVSQFSDPNSMAIAASRNSSMRCSLKCTPSRPSCDNSRRLSRMSRTLGP